MKPRITPAIAVGALALALASPLPAQAQQQPQQPPQQPPAAQDQTFDTKELKSYAVARLEVRKINDQYLPQFQGATTREEKEKIQKEATDKMVEAIQKEGMTVEEFNTISRAAQGNPDLAQRITRQMEKEAGQMGKGAGQ